MGRLFDSTTAVQKEKMFSKCEAHARYSLSTTRRESRAAARRAGACQEQEGKQDGNTEGRETRGEQHANTQHAFMFPTFKQQWCSLWDYTKYGWVQKEVENTPIS